MTTRRCLCLQTFYAYTDEQHAVIPQLLGEEKVLGILWCVDCRGMYRPAHRQHAGGPGRDGCEFCQRYVNAYAPTEETQKV